MRRVPCGISTIKVAHASSRPLLFAAEHTSLNINRFKLTHSEFVSDLEYSLNEASRRPIQTDPRPQGSSPLSR